MTFAEILEWIEGIESTFGWVGDGLVTWTDNDRRKLDELREQVTTTTTHP